jgi:hypothetical protein
MRLRWPDERGDGGNIAGTRDKTGFARDDGHACGDEHREVGLGDVARAVRFRTDKRRVGVKTREMTTDFFEVQRVALGSAC